jgi:ribonuclease HI
MKAAYVVGDTQVVRDVPDFETATGSLRSNNIAEYQALIFLLTNLRQQETQRGRPARYLIHGDSELVIRQMRGEYRVKQPHLQQLHAEAVRLGTGLDLEFRWIPRNQNRAGHLLESKSV